MKSSSSRVKVPNISALESLGSASENEKSSKPVSSDQVYGVDENKLKVLREQKPFLKDPKYFKSVKVSPSATMKMMMHVQSGVEKGIKKSITGKPTEVMGLLVGRQDTQDPHCLIISDAQALPIEGFETSVVAQSDDALTYQINLANLNEQSRHPSEKFCGWYHSHPFDQEEYSHCYLSNTDVTTQLMWQRSCEKDGDPWLAIVIDPLRSIAKGYPNMESFRVYPPDYTSVPNETPDGRIIADDKTRLQLWGNCWNRYVFCFTIVLVPFLVCV
jgi:COP9 signalosome complex subunit 5